MKITSVEQLDVFNLSHQLTLSLYKVTEKFPDSEKFGLVSQIRRCASSICANLLEGSHRFNTGEFRQFVGIANGSAGEMKYHLLLSRDLGYITEKDYECLEMKVQEISRMLRGLANSLSQKLNTNTNTRRRRLHQHGRPAAPPTRAEAPLTLTPPRSGATNTAAPRPHQHAPQALTPTRAAGATNTNTYTVAQRPHAPQAAN